ncbi:Nicotinate phosphoribosyltransferase-related protein [Beggiatoa sp. PS]|nr:Nicotinate phosphoribosyltransferase-related protein [Beggiatoa sp. PS]
MIYNQLRSPIGSPNMVSLSAFIHPALAEGHTTLPADIPYQDLLIPILRKGQLVIELPSLEQIRERVQTQLTYCPIMNKHLKTPTIYPVHLEMNLYMLKQELIKQRVWPSNLKM